MIEEGLKVTANRYRKSRAGIHPVGIFSYWDGITGFSG